MQLAGGQAGGYGDLAGLYGDQAGQAAHHGGGFAGTHLQAATSEDNNQFLDQLLQSAAELTSNKRSSS